MKRPPRENPFRADRISTLPFVGENVDALADRFRIAHRAALVGPHGSGKSTLLRAIGDALLRRGEIVLPVTLPGSATPAECAAALAPVAAADARTIVLLDGYEQLNWPARRRLRAVPRLLVTAHRRTALPTLAELCPTINTLDALLATLLPTATPACRALAHAAFHRHHGDVRETLMTLYDAWAAGAIG